MTWITEKMTMAIAAQCIRHMHRDSDYDHRPFLPQGVGEHYQSEQFRIGYAAFKETVARVLQPETIVEIGVGVGVSALAFLAGCPNSTYFGYDNDCQDGRDFPVKPSEFVNSLLSGRGFVRIADSTRLYNLPLCDFVHVDGGHDYDTCYNDVMLAWRSKARWILVDDARDSTVAAATFDALRFKSPGSVDWAYFEDTWTGNILISRVKERP